MEPLEATLFRVTADDLISEFTQFNLVIHLSKAKQLAFRLCTFFWDILLLLPSLVKPGNAFLSRRRCPKQSETWSLLQLQLLQRQMTKTWHQCQAGTRFPGVVPFFLRFSGEVEHFVHLILWNLFMPLRHDLTTVPKGSNARRLL